MSDITIKEQLEQRVPTLEEHFLRRDLLYCAPATLSFSGTGWLDKILIRNPSDSGKNIIVFMTKAYLDLAATTNQLNAINCRVFKGPTITADGTTVNTRNLTVGGSNTTQLEVYSDPTISVNGQALFRCAAINNGVDLCTPFKIEPNNEVLIQLQVNDANNGAWFNIFWAEDNA